MHGVRGCVRVCPVSLSVCLYVCNAVLCRVGFRWVGLGVSRRVVLVVCCVLGVVWCGVASWRFVWSVL